VRRVSYVEEKVERSLIVWMTRCPGLKERGKRVPGYKAQSDGIRYYPSGRPCVAITHVHKPSLEMQLKPEDSPFKEPLWDHMVELRTR
jgi:hypothetical protein